MTNIAAQLNDIEPADAAAVDRIAAISADAQSLGMSRPAAIDRAISMVDLTTLEATDTPARVRELSRTAMRPDPMDEACPRVAAVCVYPDLVPAACDELAESQVSVASVAGAFPSGRATLEVKNADVRSAIAGGADEIDVVIDRGAFLAGDEQPVFDQLTAMKDACRQNSGPDPLFKVILETGELASHAHIWRASWLAMLAGADFIKTSTGKISPGATFSAATVMLQAARDYQKQSGRRIGVKVSGGVRRSHEAISYLALAHTVIGPAALDARGFRFGASSLLQDLLAERHAAAE